VSDGEGPNGGAIIKAYIDWRDSQGIPRPTNRTIKVLGANAREALDAGIPADTIKRGLWEWHQTGGSPGHLGVFIEKACRAPSQFSRSRKRPEDRMWDID